MESRFPSIVCKISAKPQKNFWLLSILHPSANVDHSTEKKKLEVILFCNKNKTGVDCFDQTARLYSTRLAS